MGTARIFTRLEIDIDGRTYGIGDTTVPNTITFGSDLHVLKTLNVAASSSTKVFDVSDDLADFDILGICADRDLVLQLVTDDDGSVGEEANTVTLKGTGTDDDFGPVLILAADDSYANFTVDFAGGTLDVIERLNVKNNDSSNAAKVQILAAT